MQVVQQQRYLGAGLPGTNMDEVARVCADTQFLGQLAGGAFVRPRIIGVDRSSPQ
ncbi:hypothetical protein FQZ97_946470 [compost metagenome]